MKSRKSLDLNEQQQEIQSMLLKENGFGYIKQIEKRRNHINQILVKHNMGQKKTLSQQNKRMSVDSQKTSKGKSSREKQKKFIKLLDSMWQMDLEQYNFYLQQMWTNKNFTNLAEFLYWKKRLVPIQVLDNLLAHYEKSTEFINHNNNLQDYEVSYLANLEQQEIEKQLKDLIEQDKQQKKEQEEEIIRRNRYSTILELREEEDFMTESDMGRLKLSKRMKDVVKNEVKFSVIIPCVEVDSDDEDDRKKQKKQSISTTEGNDDYDLEIDESPSQVPQVMQCKFQPYKSAQSLSSINE